jgi:hypothetical protein
MKIDIIDCDAVYYARSLYANFAPGVYYNDLALCQPANRGGANIFGELLDKEENGSILKDIRQIPKVFPNPADDVIQVTLAVNNQDARVVITDMLGQKKKIIILDGSNSEHRISVDDLPVGIYFYNLIISGQSSFTGKFSIKR